MEQSVNGTTWTSLMSLTSPNGVHARAFSPTQPFVRVRMSAGISFSVANMSLNGTGEDTLVTVLPSRLAYRYGFNGMEKDEEMKGRGNSYDFGARMYDPRLGRWLTIDPKASQFPMASPYMFANNSPIIYNDPTGESGELTIVTDAAGQPTGYVIKANLHFYTGDKALSKFNHKRVVAEMTKQFNDQNLKLTYDGKTLPVTLELTSDLTYNDAFNKISFDPSTDNTVANSDAKGALPGNNYDHFDLVNNYIRLENLPIDEASFNNVGKQVGMWNVKQLYEGSTTALHEFFHSLGVGHPFQKDEKGTIIGYDQTTDAKPGDVVPLSYPRGTRYEGTTTQINPNDRRPTEYEMTRLIFDQQKIGKSPTTTTVIGTAGNAGQVLIDTKGNSEYLENK